MSSAMRITPRSSNSNRGSASRPSRFSRKAASVSNASHVSSGGRKSFHCSQSTNGISALRRGSLPAGRCRAGPDPSSPAKTFHVLRIVGQIPGQALHRTGKVARHVVTRDRAGRRLLVQGTFETFSAAGEKHFGGDLAGKLIVSGGMGGMGGAQPLAATMTGAAFLGIDVDPERIKKRLKTGYCDFMVTTLDEALRILKNAVRKKENVSVGLVGNCADGIPELAERGVVPDILTDQTSAS